MTTGATRLGLNRTGIGLAPVMAREAVAAASDGAAGLAGDDAGISALRESYLRHATKLGSMPSPSTLRGVARTLVDRVRGNRTLVFLDRLSERLAFERTSARLYGALLGKLSLRGGWAEGPTAEQISAMRAEEIAHFELLHRTITGLGADPTVLSPAADLVGVEIRGLLEVVLDSRTSVAQSVHALLLVEYADSHGWELLVQLALVLGQEEIAAVFRQSHACEERHLSRLREWLMSAAVLEATGASGRSGGAAH